MLILYTKDNCVYCEKVKQTFNERKVVYEERNIKNPDYLVEVRGYQAKTMPFMVDTFANITLGESDEIIDYGSEYSF